jgi:SARP family transcriptional regulator, regulator of embCAB operon
MVSTSTKIHQGDEQAGIAGSTRSIAQLRLLGGFELTIDNRPVLVPEGTQKVIAFLALQSAPVPRTYVAGCLWSEKNEVRANANLRSALWRLPAECAGLIAASAHALSLDTSMSIDYRNALQIARGAIHSDAGSAAIEALEILDSPLLPGWYDDWILVERERLSQLHLHALEKLARCALEEHRLEDALGLAQSIVRSEPLRETGHLILAKAHLANGNRPDAIRQVRRLDSLLREELGITASSEAWLLVDLASVVTENIGQLSRHA